MRIESNPIAKPAFRFCTTSERISSRRPRRIVSHCFYTTGVLRVEKLDGSAKRGWNMRARFLFDFICFSFVKLTEPNHLGQIFWPFSLRALILILAHFFGLVRLVEMNSGAKIVMKCRTVLLFSHHLLILFRFLLLYVAGIFFSVITSVFDHRSTYDSWRRIRISPTSSGRKRDSVFWSSRLWKNTSCSCNRSKNWSELFSSERYFSPLQSSWRFGKSCIGCLFSCSRCRSIHRVHWPDWRYCCSTW